MRGYLERLAAGALAPGGTFYPITGSIYAPEASEPGGGEPLSLGAAAVLGDGRARPSGVGTPRDTGLDVGSEGESQEGWGTPARESLQRPLSGAESVRASSVGSAAEDPAAPGTEDGLPLRQVPAPREERRADGREEGRDADVRGLEPAVDQGAWPHEVKAESVGKRGPGGRQVTGAAAWVESERGRTAGEAGASRKRAELDEAAGDAAIKTRGDARKALVSRATAGRGGGLRETSALADALREGEGDGVDGGARAVSSRESSVRGLAGRSEGEAYQPLVAREGSTGVGARGAAPARAGVRTVERRERGEQAAQREPDEIQIHIGRIEVSAVAPTAAVRTPVTPVRRTPSLDDYLRRGNGRA